MAGAFPQDTNGGFSLFYVYPKAIENELFDARQWAHVNRKNPLVSGLDSNAILSGIQSANAGILGSIRNKHWHYKNEIILMGDSAHTILPFMGQGLNLGLEDVYLFHEVFGESDDFSAYCKSRKRDTDAMTRISELQFHYLTGQTTSEENLIRLKKEAHYECRAERNLYSACAFTLDSIHDLYERDQRLEQLILREGS